MRDRARRGVRARRDTPYPSLSPSRASLMSKERPVCKLMVDSGLKEPKTRGSWAIPAIQAESQEALGLGGPRQ